jgi:hypothetical protein
VISRGNEEEEVKTMSKDIFFKGALLQRKTEK